MLGPLGSEGPAAFGNVRGEAAGVGLADGVVGEVVLREGAAAFVELGLEFGAEG